MTELIETDLQHMGIVSRAGIEFAPDPQEMVLEDRIYKRDLRRRKQKITPWSREAARATMAVAKKNSLK